MAHGFGTDGEPPLLPSGFLRLLLPGCLVLLFPLRLAALPPALTCLRLDGAAIYGSDAGEHYLGFLGSPAARDSVFNRTGPFGTSIGSQGLKNPFSDFGSPSSSLGADSLFASSPPQIRRDGLVLGRISRNPLLHDAASLAELEACEFNALAPRSGSQDSDGDGVNDDNDDFPSDPEESRDTDGDGIGDREDPDDDDDGLSDAEEEVRGTDPLLADSDADGFGDGEEVDWETDPLDRDASPADTFQLPLPVWLRAIFEREEA